jgi:hypothetical protein
MSAATHTGALRQNRSPFDGTPTDMLVCVNRWQGGAPGMVYEPARGSGFGKVGGHASSDRVTRAMSIIAAPPGTAN